MNYIGKFRDKEDRLHTITITTKVGTGTSNIVLCTPPFTEELEGDDATIFKPCKYSSATIRVLTQGASDYMFDIYQSAAQEVKVVLTDEDNKVEWTGFVTPNMYDMGFVTDKEELEIECQDALSTLQYFKYQPIEEKAKTKSFAEIIRQMLRDKTPYTYMYFPCIYENIALDTLKIAEKNFLDEDGDDWTMQDVLEEICQYLNVTCVAEGDEVYFINYSSLKGGFEYRRYEIRNSNYTDLQDDDEYVVNGGSYSESDGTISLLPSYNQISVTSKINKYESLLPDVFEEKYLENANGEWYKVLSYILDGGGYGLIKGVQGRYKFLTNRHYQTFYYDKQTGTRVDMDTCRSYPDLQNYVGATILQASFEDYNRFNYDTAFVSNPDKSLTDYILIHQHDKEAGKLVFSTKASDIPETYVGAKTKMVIKGSIRLMDRENWMYIPPDYSNKKDDFNRMNLYLECKLKWGDYYFQNYQEVPVMGGIRFIFWRSGRWTRNECTFRLFFNAPDTDHIYNKDYSVLDTSGDYGYTGIPSGYVISLPEAATIQGSIPEFSIYTRGRVDSSYRMDAIWLKDFLISLAIAKDSNVKDSEWETDTEYTNVINESYVEEGNDIECKVNTWDNKAPTYSVVMYDDGVNQYYIDEVKNLATGQTHRFEEHIIYDFVNQYKQPAIQLEVNLKKRLKPHTTIKIPFLSGSKTFIVDSYSRDYYNCNNTIKLVEEWNLSEKT